MMTREEAAHILEYSRIVSENFTQEAVTATYVMALSALRPITREQVERMRGEWTGNFNAHCSLCDAFNTMAYIGQGGNFCPACGAPMTDEAVEIRLKELEALYGQENT